jgi:hypothetical protein
MIFKTIFEYPYRRFYLFGIRVYEKLLFQFPKVAPVEKPKSLLIVKTDSIGDYVLMRNFFYELKNSNKFKEAEITLLLSSTMKGIAETLDSSSFKNIFYLPHPIWTKTESELNYFLKKLFKIGLKRHYDMILFPNFNVRAYMTLNTLIMLKITSCESIAQVGDLKECNVNDMNYLHLFSRVITNYKGKHTFEFFNNRTFFENVINRKINLMLPRIDLTKKEKKNNCYCPLCSR